MKKMLFFCGMLSALLLLPKTSLAAANILSGGERPSGTILGVASGKDDPAKDKSATTNSNKRSQSIFGMTPNQTENNKDDQHPQAAPAANANNPALAGTTDELEQAILAGETYIKLTADINIDQLAIPVKNSLTIDGDGKYTYMFNGGDNRQAGIYFAASDIEITFKNLKIGDPNISRSANNNYGIAPADDLISGSKIIVENVDYYSDCGTQPFYMQGETNQVVLKGKNSFLMTKKEAGITSNQGFAEGADFIFDESSNTRIKIENNDSYGTFRSVDGPLPVVIELKKGARLKVDSDTSFIYSEAALGNKLLIGEGAVLDINETDPLNGNLMPQDYGLDIEVQEKGRLTANTAAPSPFNSDSALNLGPKSKVKLKNKNGDFYAGGSGKIKIDNADELLFETGKRGPASPTGLASSENNLVFVAFNNETRDYGIYADDQLLETQHQASSWKINEREFRRRIVFLHHDTPDKLKNASSFKLLRNRVSNGNDGKLELLSVPDFDFGDHLVTDTTQVLRPAIQGTLTVEDTRTAVDKESQLSLKVAQPFENGDLDLPGLLTYINAAGEEQPLSEQAVLIEETVDQETREISSEWNTATDGSARGLKMSVPVEKQKAGTFTGTLEWSLADVPSN